MTGATAQDPRRRVRRRPYLDADLFRETERAVWTLYGEPEFQEVWVRVPELGIRVRALVAGEGRPVLFIHGTPHAATGLAALATSLPGVRAIVVDRPGCGLSDPLDFQGRSPAEMHQALVAVLAAVVDQVAGEPVEVVGTSLGGMCALLLATRRPELVTGVVLTGAPAIRGATLPPGRGLLTWGPIARAYLSRWAHPLDIRIAMGVLGHTRPSARGFDPGPDTAWFLAMARHTATYAHEHDLATLAIARSGIREEWLVGRDTLEALAVPSLWILGTRDPVAKPARVQAWAGHTRDATVHIVKAGHLPWLDDRDGHARLITDWWAARGLAS
ncbi:alpha/beta fold hydrolase [Demequina silvatica]|uniref:alpha/beta fold hydrolase n=1 Tax=Demequina silvatica TaxID=1638988 RepID=UPI000785626B|nr:alpha/beta hydrolase [Demequina silvatica]